LITGVKGGRSKNRTYSMYAKKGKGMNMVRRALLLEELRELWRVDEKKKDTRKRFLSSVNIVIRESKGGKRKKKEKKWGEMSLQDLNHIIYQPNKKKETC